MDSNSMPSSPVVSVIIPAYNAMAHLPETLDSVLGQTFTDFEIIIIDDGSKDSIVEWTTRIKDPRIKLTSQENQGVSAARNTGITQSCGKYIAFLDADDLWKSTKLERQVQCLDKNPEIGLVDTFILLVNAQDKPIFPVGFSYEPSNVWRDLIEQNIVLCGSTPMVRRSCIEKVGLFDCNLQGTEDWDMWVRIAKHYSFEIIKEPLVRYRQHSSSTSKRFKSMDRNTVKAIEKIYQSVPPNLQWLKKRAYGRAKRSAAGGAYGTGNYGIAIGYYLKAIICYPQLIFEGGVDRPFVKSLLQIGLNRLR